MTHKKQIAIGLLLSGIGFGLFQNCAPDVNLADYTKESADSPSDLDMNIPAPPVLEPSVSVSADNDLPTAGTNTVTLTYVMANMTPATNWSCNFLQDASCGISGANQLASLPGGTKSVSLAVLTSIRSCNYTVECTGPNNVRRQGFDSVNWQSPQPPQPPQGPAAPSNVVVSGSDTTLTIKGALAGGFTLPTFVVTHSAPPSGETYTYQWRKNGTDIPGATNASYQPAAPAGGATVFQVHQHLENQVEGGYSVNVRANKLVSGNTLTADQLSSSKNISYSDLELNYKAMSAVNPAQLCQVTNPEVSGFVSTAQLMKVFDLVNTTTKLKTVGGAALLASTRGSTLNGSNFSNGGTTMDFPTSIGTQLLIAKVNSSQNSASIYLSTTGNAIVSNRGDGNTPVPPTGNHTYSHICTWVVQ
jgi:hypothetical protein